MNISIMQPYFFPYVGYFQLMAAADYFVIYDDVQYTKKGWINRNRILVNGKPTTFSLPMKKASDYLDIRDRLIASTFDARKLEAQISGAYAKAPHFQNIMPIVANIVEFPSSNLFDFLYNSIQCLRVYLKIPTQLLVSSSLEPTNHLRAQERVLAICRQCQASTYTNAIGGLELYDNAAFAAQGVKLQFLKAHPVEYRQFAAPFQPSLSIIDVMMFNPPEIVKALVFGAFDLISGEESHVV